MKKKLKLNELQLQSFVTSIEGKASGTLKGQGITIPDTQGIEGHCTNFTCGYVACTYTYDLKCLTTTIEKP